MTVPRLGSTTNQNHSRPIRVALVLACGLALAGCGSFTETLQRGYVMQEGTLEQIPIGATQEQVLIVLGTPSTVATVSGEAFYYISQTSQRSAAFMPYEVKDQRVIAVYFDKDRRVEAAGQLRPQGRQGLRLPVADDADRRSRSSPICSGVLATSLTPSSDGRTPIR